VKRKDPRALISEASSALDVPLSSSKADSLLEYTELLRSRAIPLGLIGQRDQGRILVRHVLDSLRGATAVVPTDRWAYDLGSGAGLPGIPVAIACPSLRVALVESRRTRAAFLELAVAELGLSNAEVRWGRVEEQADLVDVCFARAFAPLARTWGAARPLLVTGGRLVHFTGGSSRELRALAGAGSMELRSVPLLDSMGALAIITR